MARSIKVGQLEQHQRLTRIKHTETDPEAVKKIPPRKDRIAGCYTADWVYFCTDIRCTAVTRATNSPKTVSEKYRTDAEEASMQT